ncbi:MAG: PKD domain-containing protein, partial [Bacteroidales bacterium]|nr:PKD domain-containing protein [Bacteroidales bacterium]
ELWYDYQNAPMGTEGRLKPGEWAYADNDALGFNTVYIRLSDGGDPDELKLVDMINIVEARYDDEKVRPGSEQEIGNPHQDGIIIRNPNKGTISNLCIYGNDFYDETEIAGSGGTAMLFISQPRPNDSIYIYNNVFHPVHLTTVNMWLGSGGEVHLYNNTFVDGAISWGRPESEGPSGTMLYIKNNVFCKKGFTLRFPLEGDKEHLDSDYNIFINADVFASQVTPYRRFQSLDEWQQTFSQDMHSLVVESDDFSFINMQGTCPPDQSDYRLTADSVCIDKGQNLDPEYQADKAGNRRGKDGGWDVGAFEFIDPDTGTDPGTDPDDQDTKINISPSVDVEVGEEVYFDGAYYQKEYDPSVQWEWDFGDGYTLKAGEPTKSTFNTGLSVIHYFMKPGTYEVKLNVSKFDMSQSPPVRQEVLYKDSITINVSGEAPKEGFELRHAPFHSRTAQYLYAVVPSGYSPDQVSLRLESSKGIILQQFTGVTEDGKQRFLLENAKLSAGDYVVIAELKNGQETVSTIREKFSKSYDGAPEVGINENNAFILKGEELFFPIGPFMLNKDLLPLWKPTLNTLHTYGWYSVKDDAAWNDYAQFADLNGIKAIGPTGWSENKLRNSNPAQLLKYVEASKGSDGILGWCWDDEPNLGGRYGCNPASVIAAWTYLVNQLDPHHPSGQQYYGYNYLSHYNPLAGSDGYSYMGSEALFGGKKAFTADFITYDIYPIEHKEHVSLAYSDRGVVDLWAEAMDNFNWNMDGLIPTGTFVETQNVDSWNRNSDYETHWDAGPTPGDLRTQLWTAIVHNMKSIYYFEFFSSTQMDNMSVLSEFKETVTALTPIILGPPSSHTVTHNCHDRGQRVDLMVRETPSDYYIFAVRVTEPESEWNEVMEPETIEFEINTGTKSPVA